MAAKRGAYSNPAFQSAPVIADGRATGVSINNVIEALFQSAPVIADGRALHEHRVAVAAVAVSIRARHR